MIWYISQKSVIIKSQHLISSFFIDTYFFFLSMAVVQINSTVILTPDTVTHRVVMIYSGEFYIQLHLGSDPTYGHLQLKCS